MAGGGGGDLDPQLRGHGGGARAGLRGHDHGHQRGHRVRQGGDHAECQQTGVDITRDDDDQPKLRGSGVVVTLVCEYTRDPEGI